MLDMAVLSGKGKEDILAGKMTAMKGCGPAPAGEGTEPQAAQDRISIVQEMGGSKRKKGAEVMKQEKKSRPAWEFRIGKVSALIWENHDGKEEAWYSVTVVRAYQDKDGAWKGAKSFGRDDLLILAEVARQAFLWIDQQSKASSEPQGDHASEA